MPGLLVTQRHKRQDEHRSLSGVADAVEGDDLCNEGLAPAGGCTVHNIAPLQHPVLLQHLDLPLMEQRVADISTDPAQSTELNLERLGHGVAEQHIACYQELQPRASVRRYIHHADTFSQHQ